MNPALGVAQRLAEHHVAAALAIDRSAGSCGLLQPRTEAPGRGEPCGMQLGVAARQVDGVGSRVGHLVGEWREQRQLGALATPALQHRRVREEERVIARDGDPLTERRQRGDGCSAGKHGGTGERDQPIYTETRPYQRRRPRDHRFRCRVLAGRNQAEMALGQHQLSVRRQGTEAGDLG